MPADRSLCIRVLLGLLLALTAAPTRAQNGSVRANGLPTGAVQADTTRTPEMETREADVHPLLRSATNAIRDETDALAPFFEALRTLGRGEQRAVRIVHIGDSHLQGGEAAKALRDGLQARFGNAGRGYVFPYRLGRTNGPRDLRVWSDRRWRRHRVVFPDRGPTGAGGYTLRTDADTFALRIGADVPEPVPFTEPVDGFDRVVLFRDSLSTHRVTLSTTPPPSPRTSCGETVRMCLSMGADSGGTPMPWSERARRTDDTAAERRALGDAERLGPHTLAVRLDAPATDLWLEGSAPTQGAGQTLLYGFSLERADALGVLYHAMGVNGAHHHHYVGSPHFFDHLAILRPDLVIVALGTNEATQNDFTPDSLARDLRVFADALADAAPHAAVLIVTPPDLPMTPQSSRQVKLVAEAQRALALERRFALWDFAAIMRPFADWQAEGLAQKDGVHLTPAGYTMHGQLLLDALLSGYAAHARRPE